MLDQETLAAMYLFHKQNICAGYRNRIIYEETKGWDGSRNQIDLSEGQRPCSVTCLIIPKQASSL